MKPGSLTRYAGAALWVVLTVGCGSATLLVGPRSVDPADWEVLQETPGERILEMTSAAQNAVFATGTQHLYRLRRSEPDLWEVVDTVPDLLFSLQAPNDTTLFAIGRRPSVLYTWTEGTSWSARVLEDAATGVPVAVRLSDFWWEGPGSFYISGSDNSIVHITDSTARIEKVPAVPGLNDDLLRAVGGVTQGSGHPVFAVSSTRVFRRDPGGWTVLDTIVVPELGRRCAGTTIVALRDDLLIGGGGSGVSAAPARWRLDELDSGARRSKRESVRKCGPGGRLHTAMEPGE